jgi:hypothetical protein
MNADPGADFRCCVLAAKISVEISFHPRANGICAAALLRYNHVLLPWPAGEAPGSGFNWFA